MNVIGYIKLYRSFFEHDFWTEPREFSKAEAWVDLIRLARFADGTQMVGNRILEVRRGELVASVRFLADRWGWASLGRVTRYLEMLEKQNMIVRKTEQGISIINLCKYETYNASEFENGTPTERKTERERNGSGTATERERNKEEERKESKERKEGEEAAVAGKNEPFATWIFDLKADDLFREQVARQHRLVGDEFENMLSEFVGHKAAVGELNHRTYSDFRKNFLFWIPKNLELKSKTTQHGKTRNHANLIDEETARRVFARVTEGDF